MERYESYKPSGVKWLGDIPENWDVRRNIGLFDERKEINQPDMELLSVTINRGVIKQEEITEKKDSSNEDKSKYKVVRKDDLAYNKMRMWQGAIGQSEYEGIVSPAYVILSPRDRLYSRYYHYLYRTEAFIAEANRHSYGLCLDMNSLRYEDFKTIYSPVPPRTEVERIVAFLDQKTAEIDAAITKKERLIGLLSEQLTLLQTKVISYGLNQQHSQKNWRSVPLKWFIKIGSGDFLAGEKITSEPDQLHAVPVIGGNGVMGYTAESNTNTRVIAVGRVGALCGNVHPIEMPAWITDNALRITCSSDFDFAYMVTALRSLNLNRLANKNAQPLITGSMIKDQIVSLPPLDEQVAISQFLADAERSTNHTCRSIENEIQRLLELRSLVISHTVTGMIRI